jgi:hypothetical protein
MNGETIMLRPCSVHRSAFHIHRFLALLASDL